jgi:LmeA-like phospholipid-binding
MKFSTGCLTGIVLGILFAVGAFFAYTFLFYSDNLDLFPATVSGDPDLTVTISQSYLNDELRAGLAARGLNTSELAVKLHAPNQADASMTLNLKLLGQSFSVRPQATFHFGVSQGAIQIVLDRVNVAGFSVPQSVVNQQLGDLQRYAQDQLNAEVERTLANTGLHVIGVETTENDLIVKLAR